MLCHGHQVGNMLVPNAPQGYHRVRTAMRVLLSVSLVILLIVLLMVQPVPTLTEPKEEEQSALLIREMYEPGYSSSHPNLCPMMGENLKLLVLVTSAPSNALARSAVRRTWGLIAQRRDVAIAFILGIPPPELQHTINTENALHEDLIIGQFIDSYSNLTLKSISMLEWVDTYCPLAPYLLKTDDDVFVNMPLLMRFARRRTNVRKMIWGKVYDKLPPHRNTAYKYYVPRREFSGAMFPRFTTGPAYLMSADCVSPLLNAAMNETFMRLEDVFLTGVVASKLGILRSSKGQFYNRKLRNEQGIKCELLNKFTFHKVRWHEQLKFWRLLRDDSIKCVSRRKHIIIPKSVTDVTRVY